MSSTVVAAFAPRALRLAVFVILVQGAAAQLAMCLHPRGL
jgi:hypothetical protein